MERTGVVIGGAAVPAMVLATLAAAATAVAADPGGDSAPERDPHVRRRPGVRRRGRLRLDAEPYAPHRPPGGLGRALHGLLYRPGRLLGLARGAPHGCLPKPRGHPRRPVPHVDEWHRRRRDDARGAAEGPRLCHGHLRQVAPRPLTRFLPTRNGFDDYLGLPYSNDMWPNHPERMRFPPLPLYSRDAVLTLNPDQSLLTREYTRRAVAFIEENSDRPFFVYLAHTMPHVPIFASGRFRGRSKQGLYADVVEEIDDSVGQVLAALRRAWASSGPARDIPPPTTARGSRTATTPAPAGPLREGKGTLRGRRARALRGPLAGAHPGRYGGTRAGHDDRRAADDRADRRRAPPERPIDGLDISPLLLGDAGARSPHEGLLFYYGTELRAVRGGRYKLVLPHRSQTLDGPAGSGGRPGKYKQMDVPLALYDLVADISETTDVAPAHPDVVARLSALAEQAREDLGDSLTNRTGRGVREPRRARPLAAAAEQGARP